ncbi:putative Pectin lyase superfamily protein [Hibiscus syriacus]|uniref:Polygalacturonase n=1 Tax=Hibiscus syriacus TaxID=106335 RepID=A0A6A3CY66_HIBSY|nr:putative Pectin lyase superfamily protein [Hibiscus syriacus]
MGSVGIIAILVLGLVLPEFQAFAQFDPDKGMELAKSIATGTAPPDVKVFNVLDFGAKADGKSLSSINFIRAFKEACNHAGKAMLLIPKGEFVLGSTLFSGPCSAAPPLMVSVVGTIIAQANTKPAEDADWINFNSIDGLIISGKGVFNGKGETVWKPKCDNQGCGRMPATLKFIKVDNAVISGIQSVNAKGFHVMISICNNFRIDDVNISAPAESPNTDGIHMSKTSMLKITNCRIGTGDDCVSIIHGSTNISVENTACGPGHGISIGSLGHYDSEADVFGITVRNCTLTDTDNGARIKTYRNDNPSKASGIIFEDLVMKNVKNPILIDQEYGNQGDVKSSKVSISDVQFTNIKGTSASKVAVQLICSKSDPCQGVSLKDIDLQFAGTKEANIPFSSNCTNVKVAYSGTQSPPPCPP